MLRLTYCENPSLSNPGHCSMKCHECGHENTEGAWLCINCGAKLKRDDAETEGQESTEQADEPSRFDPNMSENLRRLRERATGEKGSSSRGPQASPGIPKLEIPDLTGGSRILGLPAAVWVVFAVIFIIALMLLSNLQ